MLLQRISIYNKFSKFSKFSNPIFIQKREYCYPVMMISGVIHFYTFTQRWNPYYPREYINTLNYVGNFLFVSGLLITIE